MTERKNYSEPYVELVIFGATDVITVSQPVEFEFSETPGFGDRTDF